MKRPWKSWITLMLFGGLVGCSSTISVGVGTSAMQHDEVVHPDTKDVMQQIDQSYGYEFAPRTDSTSVGVTAEQNRGHDAEALLENQTNESKSTEVKAHEAEAKDAEAKTSGTTVTETEITAATEPVMTPVTPPPMSPDTSVVTVAAATDETVTATVTETSQTLPLVPEQKKEAEQTASEQKDWAYLPGIDEKFPVRFDHDAEISQLHTTDVSYFRRNGKEWVQFSILSGAKKSTSVSLPVMRWMKVPSADVQHAVVITWVEFGREIKERTEFMLTDSPQKASSQRTSSQRTSPVLLGQSFFRDMGPIDVEQLIGH